MIEGVGNVLGTLVVPGETAEQIKTEELTISAQKDYQENFGGVF